MAHSKYLTFAEFQSYGGTASESDFNLAEMRARKRVDRLTDSRVQAMAEIPEAVKMCIYAVINVESVTGREAQASNPLVTSFNNDGYSESYGNALAVDDADRNTNQIIGEYLWGEVDDLGIPLLYRGVRPC